jgi:hypothetical protein
MSMGNITLMPNTKLKGVVNRTFIYSIIISLMNLPGCYYQQQMNPEEVDFKDNPEIIVTTQDTVYKLNGNDY